MRHRKDTRLLALRNFAISITILNIAGYTVLGFEQPWLWPLIAVATGYAAELILEAVGARSERRIPSFQGGGVRGFIEFLYPAHITSLAVNMLLYVNDQVLVMMFAVMVAISGKWLLRAPVRGRLRHYMNPSNFGITVVLLLFPWVSVAPPYHFTEYLSGPADWVFPAIIVVFGTLLNAKLTDRMWLIAGWLGGFLLQALVRSWLFDAALPAGVAIMTGVAFVLFTNYMITDPGTTPSRPGAQLAFGGGAAGLYGLLMALHIVYGLFFALALTCLIRGCYLWAVAHSERSRSQPAEPAGGQPAAATPGAPLRLPEVRP